MKKSFLLFLPFLIFFSFGFLQSELPTKIITNKTGVKFTVAQKIPEQLNFLMGSYQNGTTTEKIILNAEGIITIAGNRAKYYFECTENHLIAKAPISDYKTTSYLNPNFNRIDTEQNSFNTLVNLIVEYSDGRLSEFKILINFEEKQAKLFGCIKKINENETEFNSITQNAFIPLPPNASDIKSIAADVAARAKVKEKYKHIVTEYHYELRMLILAGIDVEDRKHDDLDETDKLKLKIFWNRYKTLFTVDTVSFGVPNGNLLKYALAASFPELIDTFASIFGLDINFVDPADGLNLFDYLQSEITRLKKQENSSSAVALLENYKAAIIGLGGKSNKK